MTTERTTGKAMRAAGALAGASVIALGAVGCGGGGGGGNSVVPGVESIVFAQRAFVRGDGSHDISGGTRQVIDYERYNPGGGVFVLSPPTPDGDLRSLTDDYTGVDIAGLDLSFDAREVVFSMRHDGDEHYHVYIAPVDGSAMPRQITDGPWNDLRPIFVPGGRVAYISTYQFGSELPADQNPFGRLGLRRDEYERGAAPQLSVVSTEGGTPTVCSQNLSHIAEPFLLSNGQIGFSRWEHLGPLNDVKLFRMNPDCSGMEGIMVRGGLPANSFVQASELDPGTFVSIATSRSRTIQSGALFHIDARNRTSTADVIPIDEQRAIPESLTPAVPTGSGSPASGVGRYRNPRGLFEVDGDNRSWTGELLVSWSDGDVNDRNEIAETAPQYGIYLFDPESQRRTLVFDNPGTWDLYAIPVQVRPEPPAIGQGVMGNPADMYSRPAILAGADVRTTMLEETVSGAQFGDGVSLDEALDATTHVRIIEGFSGEIGGVGMFGLTMHEGAAIMGETPVYADGSWRAEVPAYLPYHLQPIDRFGLAIRNQLLWIQAMPGENRACGGCHSDRAQPINLAPTLTAQVQPADRTTLRRVLDRQEIPWAGATTVRNLQDMLTASCAGCHDGGASDPFAGLYYEITVTPEGATEPLPPFQIPYLDLSDRPITTYYERDVVTYPASYVSLLMASAMMGDMEVDTTHLGGREPVEWIQPGSARHSRLIQYMNVNAFDDANAWAWSTPSHPENVAGAAPVSRADRMMLIHMADLGGQYYSRFNTENAGEWSSPRY
jgi:hypothetical protein